ncbi:VP13A-like protein [Mya arenaria]|uniref:VP13A-like protein n=1 Tax=Mya arenaria TaxID=6604 RepID=A0ABY7G6R8_MYAAR|nr:VP13A-like protein [Mya arenaria]
MVFESIVVDLINKYLGDFVENLDKSQLKLGIWGGDVVLNELDLKESALDDLDLPVKIKAGHIGKLTLKIPWKNLYTEPVIATIDGLYALAVPNVGIKYNAEKEEKEHQETKQKKLRALEEAKKLEAEKDQPKEKKKDSFAEKFATQVIKNLQVEVRNIHVRYEDKYTNPKQPFSIGATLKELLFRTTDENWKPCIIKEAVSQIYKLVKLEQLAVYWNSHSTLYEDRPKADILSILEETVRRRGKMWSWEHIREHRDKKNQYREAYIKKLESKKVGSDLQKTLDECEAYLDVFNITVIRQQAEIESVKRGLKRAEEKKNAGWFGGMFGGGKKKDEAKKKSDAEQIQEQFYEQFNSDEKKKLYDAIGYQENESDPTLPKAFVALRIVTKLNNVSLTLKDDKIKEPQLLKLQLKNVYSTVGQRPAASAIRVEAKMDRLTVLGTQQGDCIPRMVSSVVTDQVMSLVDFQFETNPLDGECDARVKVGARPVQIIYDAAAMSKYEDIKEQTATGMQHAIDQQKYTEISVDLQSSYVIVPHGGIWTKGRDVSKLILDLGHLKIGSERSQSDIKSKSQLGSLEDVMTKAYDKFNISLDNIQLLMVHANEDWQAIRRLKDSPTHILCPISLNILLEKCMFDKDPRMAKMKVKGELPLVSLNISDKRLQEVISLATSIPLPESEPEAPKDQFAEISLNIAQRKGDMDCPLLRLVVNDIGTGVKVRTFDMVADAHLGSVYLQYLKAEVTEGGPAINIVNTPQSVHGPSHLLNVNYLKANTDAPDFATTYKKTEQTVNVDFASLELLLHQEAILDLLATADETEKSKELVKKKHVFKKDPDLIDMKLKAGLKMFSVAICSQKKMITDIRVKGIEAEVTLQERQTQVSAVLKGISVQDPSPETFYPNILEIEGTEMLTLNLAIFNNNTEGERYDDMNNVDMKVKVMIGKIKVTFLNKFVADLLAFADNFQEAQAKLKEASTAMAEITQDAVQNLQETASRLSLQVEMHAPLILMPQNSKCYDVLIVDLGHLQVKNNFEKLGQRAPSGIPAVLEKMNVTLTNVKISRAKVDASQFVKAEVELLQPVTISVNICRNLSAAWYHDSPDIDISGTLNLLQLCLSQGDFTAMMLTLNENLSEGQTKPAPKQETSETLAIESAGQEQAIVAEKSAGVQSAPAAPGSSTQTSGLVVRDASKLLGGFALDFFSLKGRIMSNNDIDTAVKLKDMMMDDKRMQKQGGITKMMERSKKGGGKDMIDVSFKQAGDDKTIDVHMSSLYVCVCLDFLMSVADFFVKGLPQTETPPPLAIEDQKAIKPKEVATQAPPPVGEMNITVVIDRPEFIMIEDQARENTNALMLDMELKFQMRQSPETMDMSASIRNLGIVSCKYNNRTGGAQILTPCDISFYSKTPHGEGAHMDVSTSDLILNISPGTIRTMSAIAAGLSQQSEEATAEEVVPADLWQFKRIQDCNFWFLKAVDTEPLSLGTGVEEPLTERGEQLILKVPTVVVKIEGGVGNRTVPLLITDMSFEGEVRDWTGKLSVESRLKLEVAYYNEKVSVWEPLLEPVLHEGKYRRWELSLEVEKNEDVDLGLDEDEDTDNIRLPPPKMSINIKSTDSLNLTMTKACLESLTNLGKAFGDAYQLVEPTLRAGEVLDPFIIRNETGEDLMLKLDNTFEMPETAVNTKVRLRSGDILPLKNKEAGNKLSRQASVIRATQNQDEKKMIFQVEKFDTPKELNIKRAEKRLFHFTKSKDTDQWAVVADTSIHLGQKTLIFRSAVQVKNHLLLPVDVYYKDPSTGNVKLISHINPGQLYSLPLNTIYTTTGQFMFRPIKDGCVELSEPISWRGAENLGLKQLACKGDNVHQPFYIKLRAEIEAVYYEGGEMPSAKSTVFHLYPTAIFHNLLPYDVKVMLEGTEDEMMLKKGCNMPLDHACIGKTNMEVMISNYLDKDWHGRRVIDFDIPELSILSFESYQGKKKVTMDLGLHFKKGEGSINVSVFSPYWMVNKTTLLLRYKAGDDEPMEHAPDVKDIIMFSFKKGSLFSKKKDDLPEKKTGTLERKKEGKNKPKVKEMKQSGKASLCIGEGDWSDKFSLDVVGSSGTVQSKNKNRTWEVGVSIVLSSSGLTKVVTFTPFYMLVNSSPYTYQCKETITSSEWIEVPPKQCVPLWPLQSGKEMKMQATVKDSDISTNHFLFNKPHSSLMRLDNNYGGINVEVQETESAMVTTFTNYKDGLATVNVNIQIMAAGMAGFYTWEDAIGKRELVWSCGEKKDVKNDLSQDGIGEFFYNSDVKVYWVSFLSGMQRVLLFTHDLALATIAQEAGELERLEQEIIVSLQDMGMSLVNNYTQKEVAFLGLTSSGFIWEEKRKRRHKAFTLKSNLALEQAYQKFDLEKVSGRTPPEKINIDKMEVNFNEMMMFKPNKRQIRRSFQDGIWIQYKTSPHQVQFHAKINRVQVHLSFSLQGGGDGKAMQLHANVINVFLQSVGVVLTDIQDVVFKLGFFQREHKFYNNKQLTGEMTSHYAGQAIKQMYVLVLGLDVLGNPFGLLRGMAEGIEDLFYEPYQGAIQGPEEFAEGMMLGVKSLFGHAVGGAAGAVSRITGTLGKGIAALTLDDDYQKKRREALNKRPANVGEGFARGGKGLGVFDGVTGIVRKPIEGAKKEGVEGFFKGVGKGLVGVVTRPTSGVIDFASSSFEGIKRIAENVGEIHRLRPPRRFYKDAILRPYNKQEAEGCAVLIETEKGRYYNTDEYVAHVIFGSWNCEFTYTWTEIKEKPRVSAKGLEIILKEKEKKGFFGSTSSKKDIHIADKKIAEFYVVKYFEEKNEL